MSDARDYANVSHYCKGRLCSSTFIDSHTRLFSCFSAYASLKGARVEIFRIRARAILENSLQLFTTGIGTQQVSSKSASRIGSTFVHPRSVRMVCLRHLWNRLASTRPLNGGTAAPLLPVPPPDALSHCKKKQKIARKDGRDAIPPRRRRATHPTPTRSTTRRDGRTRPPGHPAQFQQETIRPVLRPAGQGCDGGAKKG